MSETIGHASVLILVSRDATAGSLHRYLVPENIQHLTMTAADEKLVVEHALAFFEAWKQRDLKESDFYRARDEAIEKIMCVKGMADCLAENDVLMVLQNVVFYTQKDLDSLSQDDLERYVRNRLLKKQKYTAIFPLYEVFNFPRGMHIGPGMVLAFDDFSENVRGILESDWSLEFEREPGVYAGKREEFMKERKACTFLKVEVEACGFERASQKADTRAEDCLVILRSIFDHAFPIPASLIFAEDGSIRGRLRKGRGYSSYLDAMAGEVAYWTDILNKSNPSDLEGRLRRAYRLHGMSRTLDRPELNFILLAVGLETMLLGKGDRDYLRQRVAEKAAFLIAHDKETRVDVYESVKALYDKRSGFVHSGSGSVTEEDVREINRVFWKVVRAIHRLIVEGYIAVEKVDGEKTIDALIEDLRFR